MGNLQKGMFRRVARSRIGRGYLHVVNGPKVRSSKLAILARRLDLRFDIHKAIVFRNALTATWTS